MGLQQEIEGTLVGVTERSYKGFKTETGDEVGPGVTRLVYVSQGFATEPVAVKVKEAADFGCIAGEGFGARVVLTCDLRAKGNRIEAQLVPGQVAVGARS